MCEEDEKEMSSGVKFVLLKVMNEEVHVDGPVIEPHMSVKGRGEMKEAE